VRRADVYEFEPGPQSVAGLCDNVRCYAAFGARLAEVRVDMWMMAVENLNKLASRSENASGTSFKAHGLAANDGGHKRVYRSRLPPICNLCVLPLIGAHPAQSCRSHHRSPSYPPGGKLCGTIAHFLANASKVAARGTADAEKSTRRPIAL